MSVITLHAPVDNVLSCIQNCLLGNRGKSSDKLKLAKPPEMYPL